MGSVGGSSKKTGSEMRFCLLTAPPLLGEAAVLRGARGKSIYKNLNFFLERIQPEKLYPTSLRVCWRGRRVGVGVSRMNYFLIWDLSPVTIESRGSLASCRGPQARPSSRHRREKGLCSGTYR